MDPVQHLIILILFLLTWNGNANVSGNKYHNNTFLYYNLNYMNDDPIILIDMSTHDPIVTEVYF